MSDVVAQQQEAIAKFLKRAYAALDATDYYSILGVERTSDAKQIKDAYYLLAVRLHPDRHGDWMDDTLRRKLTTVYARIAEAYKILSDGERREQYNTLLNEGRKRWRAGAAKPKRRRTEDDVANPAARKFFVLGREALVSNNGKSAVMNLRMALSMDPMNKVIREALAKAEQLAKRQGGA